MAAAHLAGRAAMPARMGPAPRLQAPRLPLRYRPHAWRTSSTARRTPPSCRFAGDSGDNRMRYEGVGIGGSREFPVDKLPPKPDPRYLVPERDLLGAEPWSDLVGEPEAGADEPAASAAGRGSRPLFGARPAVDGPAAWRSKGSRGPSDPAMALDAAARRASGGPGGGRGDSWLPWWVTVLAICAVAWRLANRSWVYRPVERPAAVAAAAAAAAVKPLPETVLGHRKVREAPQADLVRVRDGRGLSTERLRSAASESFEEMCAAARSDGVVLLAVSGYRSVDDQQALFFGIKSERLQTVSQRAKVSAPPGYSEHHTGYAMDIGTPGTKHLEEEFERTEAFRWLQNYAAVYHFELSFPRNNPQGILYEPWHWRYVGTVDALHALNL